MMAISRWLSRVVRNDAEAGIALPMVIGTGMVMLLLVTTALSTSVSGLVKASGDQNWVAASSAAYAGVEEYESRLANDNAYMIYGNSAAAFSTTSTLTLPTGALVNPAFGIGASGTWGVVEGSGGRATYRYEVDTSEYSSSGVLRIRSTGRVGNSTRTIVANLKQQGFIDFLYFTDYEIQDPDQNGDSVATCVKYAWEGRPPPSTGQCSDIAFGGGDTINGPMHSNDTIRACDATFNGNVTTANNPATGLRYLKQNSNGTSCSGQVFANGNPTYSPKVGMPQTNSEMKNETRSDLPIAVVAVPGCLYTGPTSITLTNDGKMTIRSPWTKKTNVAGSPATSGTTPAVCGTPGDGSNGLGSSSGATIPVLDRNLIFVQNVPTTAGNPNTWPSPTTRPPGYTSSTCAAGNGIGYPVSNEYVDSISTSYGCTNGDIFVQGTLSGAMTLAAENYVYVTGDIKYKTALTDVLGIVGQNAVWVWNPVKLTGYYWSPSYSSLLGNNRTINAAILSVSHTFQVQNYNRGGDQGTLTINGAISQKFRGIVRSGSNGYTKAYSYDDRFRYIAPPKFLSPVSTTYGVNVVVDVKPAFTAAGAAIP